MTESEVPEKLVVLTRDEDGNRLWKTQLTKRHITVYELTCIETAALADSPRAQQVLQNLSDVNWLIFTSAQGVNYFAGLLESSVIDRRTLAKLKIAAVGRTTSDAVTARGLVVSFTPTRADARSLASQLPHVKNHPVLIIGSTLHDPKTSDILASRGAHVETLAVYETRLVTSPVPEFEMLLSSSRIAQVIFASPSAVTAYCERLSPEALSRALTVPAIAIGPTTTSSLKSQGFAHIATAPSPSVVEIVKLI
jgi:uroporphyrinogen III methyltransferase/synthase